MNGRILQGRWPDAPPPRDEDYFAPSLDGPADIEANRESASSSSERGWRVDETTRCEETTTNEAAEDSDGGGVVGQAQADKAVALASECSLFADDQDADSIYADIFVEGHRETLRLRSTQFREWLRYKYFLAYRKGLKADIVTQAIETIVATAKYGGDRRSAAVFQRSARVGDTIYLDLCNDQWEVVEVDKDGWRLVSTPPVRFCRSRGMLPIPAPTPGGSLEQLRAVLNVKSETDFVLMVAWLLHALGAVPPYPLLPLGGEQGTGKSTIAEILRTLIDPNKLPLRSMPVKEDDLFVSAARSHVAVFDNLSSIPGWTSDALCRLADGSGLGKRTLYSDDDETLVMAASPIILTAIGDVVSRPDLADRAVFATLEVIPEDSRRPKKELLAEFDRARPAILGVLLTALSHGLRTAPWVRLDRLPRMADFARWATACEGALWAPGTFMQAYTANRAAAVEAVLEADELACVLRRVLSRPGVGMRWQGTCTELLHILNSEAGHAAARSRSHEWPRTASSLSNRLRKIAPGLRAIGIETRLGDRTSTKRLVSFGPRGELAATPSSPSSPSSPSFTGPPAPASDGRDGADGRSGISLPTTRAAGGRSSAGDTVAPCDPRGEGQ